VRERLTIAVAGAGIGGLAAACLLADDGHRVTLYDRFPEPRPIGSGLVIQPVGQEVLATLGLRDQAMTLGQPLTRLYGENATGRPVLDVSYAPTQGLGIHRATLHGLLWQAAQARAIPIHAGAQVTGRDGPDLLIDGHRTARAHLIVDAMGAHSPLSPLTSRPLPYGALWTTVDWPATDLPLTELRQRYRAARQMIGVLPIGRLPGDPTPKAALFWSTRTDAPDPDWTQQAESLWPAARPFLAQITNPAQMTLARYSHGTLRRPYADNIVHIGDAAHRASPQLGQGANMALLDAQALAFALRHADGQDPLALYARARRSHVALYQTFSALFTPQYQSDSRVLPALRDHLLFPLSQLPPLPRLLTRLVCGRLVPPLASLARKPTQPS
jgi:2-polyprenyl-6-methoxyphenol hydroxylase-like FAD-dependent oxidoreductase